MRKKINEEIKSKIETVKETHDSKKNSQGFFKIFKRIVTKNTKADQVNLLIYLRPEPSVTMIHDFHFTKKFFLKIAKLVNELTK